MGELTILKASLLGALQGATEFLPVSSSGHLVIAQGLLGVELKGAGLLALDVCLHFGTLIAVIAVFWRDIVHILWALAGRADQGGAGEVCGLDARQSRRLAGMVVLATIPAAAAGLLFRDFFETLVSNPACAAAMLLVTGAILWSTRFVKGGGRHMPGVGWSRALLIGIGQAVAIVPGISRSGATISAGLFLGLNRDLAARFSFLMAIPAIAGATILQAGDLAQLSKDALTAIAIGTIASAIVGFICIRWLLGIVCRGRLSYFAYYCWAIGILVIVFNLVRS